MGSWGQHSGSAYTQGSYKLPQTKSDGHVKTMCCTAESGNIIGRPLKVCTEAASASTYYSQFETPSDLLPSQTPQQKRRDDSERQLRHTERQNLAASQGLPKASMKSPSAS